MKKVFYLIVLFLGLQNNSIVLGQQRVTSDVSKMTAEELNQKAENFFFGENGEFMNKEKAKEYWLKAANLGDAHAKFALVSTQLVEGEQAMKLLRSSAEQMYPRAMNLLSRCYLEKGKFKWFPDADVEQSFYWARLSAEAGDAEGQYLYGGHFNNGSGVPKNYDEAIKWLTKTAGQGYLEAMIALATAYQKGWYVSQNKEEMYFWWKKAAETGDARSQYEYANVLFNKEGDEEVTSRDAFPWFQKAADQNYVEAYSDMVMYYMFGWGGIRVDIPTALTWARKGVARNDVTCCWLLSEIYRQYNNVVNISLDEQIKALEYAAEHGHYNAKAMLTVFRDFKPTGPNTEAWSVIIELANSGSSRAMAFYGGMLMCGGMGLQQDRVKGADFIRRAVQMGDTFAYDMAKLHKVQL